MPDKQSAITRRLIRDGLTPLSERVVEEPLAAAVRALEEIANPTYGIGFRGLKQIAKRGLREVNAAMRSQQDAAA